MALGCTRAKDPAGRQFPVADPIPGLAWKALSDLWGVLSVLSTIVALMVPRSHTQHSWLAIMLVAKPITLSRLLKLRGDAASCWNWKRYRAPGSGLDTGVSALVWTAAITPSSIFFLISDPHPPLCVFWLSGQLQDHMGLTATSSPTRSRHLSTFLQIEGLDKDTADIHNTKSQYKDSAVLTQKWGWDWRHCKLNHYNDITTIWLSAL